MKKPKSINFELQTVSVNVQLDGDDHGFAVIRGQKSDGSKVTLTGDLSGILQKVVSETKITQ